MLGQLFEEEPARWGLRGDPHLWRAMRQSLSATPLPATVTDLDSLIATAFQHLTGHAIDEEAFFYVERFAHGGMSSGMIAPSFWRDIALPILRLRYHERRSSNRV